MSKPIRLGKKEPDCLEEQLKITSKELLLLLFLVFLFFIIIIVVKPQTYGFL